MSSSSSEQKREKGSMRKKKEAAISMIETGNWTDALVGLRNENLLFRVDAVGIVNFVFVCNFIEEPRRIVE